MDFKEIKNTNHYLFDNIDEFAVHYPDGVVRHNWRHGQEGEWVYTDDGFVCQILRKLDVKQNDDSPIGCIRTVCGTFIAKDTGKEMLGEDGIAENIYTFSGTNKSKEKYNTRKRNSRELLFARKIIEGKNSVEAYKIAYPDARSSRYIKDRAERLRKTETIDKMIDQERRKKLDAEGVTDNWLIERYKTIADLSENDNAKLRSLDSLAKISGLFETEVKKSEQVTIWRGFSPEQLEEVTKHGKPEIIAHAEKDEND
tara:strand:- start:276 stop:1043 length:768 start_codon:yes stop_codon:yes gene_type:complete